MEVDRLEDPDVAGDGQRVLPDEQVLVRLEAVHRVARPDADHALVGLDADDRDREGPCAARVPGRRERRLERDTQALEPDRGDAHHDRSIAEARGARCPARLRYCAGPAWPGDPLPTARDRPPEEAAEDTSFARGLRVFLTIADRGEIRADELSTLLETPLSTIYRYLRTLTEFGFVERHGGRLSTRPAAAT